MNNSPRELLEMDQSMSHLDVHQSSLKSRFLDSVFHSSKRSPHPELYDLQRSFNTSENQSRTSDSFAKKDERNKYLQATLLFEDGVKTNQAFERILLCERAIIAMCALSLLLGLVVVNISFLNP